MNGNKIIIVIFLFILSSYVFGQEIERTPLFLLLNKNSSGINYEGIAKKKNGKINEHKTYTITVGEQSMHFIHIRSNILERYDSVAKVPIHVLDTTYFINEKYIFDNFKTLFNKFGSGRTKFYLLDISTIKNDSITMMEVDYRFTEPVVE